MDWRYCTFLAELSAHLYDRGYRNITNFDISTVAISQMSDTYADLEDMECKIPLSHWIGLQLFCDSFNCPYWLYNSHCYGCKESGVHSWSMLRFDHRQRYGTLLVAYLHSRYTALPLLIIFVPSLSMYKRSLHRHLTTPDTHRSQPCLTPCCARKTTSRTSSPFWKRCTAYSRPAVCTWWSRTGRRTTGSTISSATLMLTLTSFPFVSTCLSHSFSLTITCSWHGFGL